MVSQRFLEDFVVGQVYKNGPIVVEAEQIKHFAAQFDPQPFHLDEEAARDSFFGELVASGWHTAAMTMGLMVRSDIQIAGGAIGAGVEEVRWPRPVQPHDALRVEIEIMAVRPSKSRPDSGMIKLRVHTLNQDDLPVQTMIANVLVLRRPAL